MVPADVEVGERKSDDRQVGIGADAVDQDQGGQVDRHPGDADDPEPDEEPEVAPAAGGASFRSHPRTLPVPPLRASWPDTMAYRPGMSASRFSGPVLPSGEASDLWVVDGHVTYEPQAGAETVARGWIVPGLVDAHNHLGLDDPGAVGDEEVERQALADRDAGALLLRDCGSPADTRWVQEREDLPRLIRAGRHIARTRRYLRNFGHEVEPEELSAYVAQEARSRRRLGQARGGLDLPRGGRPRPVVPRRGVRRGDRAWRTRTARR